MLECKSFIRKRALELGYKEPFIPESDIRTNVMYQVSLNADLIFYYKSASEASRKTRISKNLYLLI